MSQQERAALEIADHLEAGHAEMTCLAVAELRRLHAENEALRSENRVLTRQNGEWQREVERDTALVRQALEALIWADMGTYFGRKETVIAALRTRLGEKT